MFGTIIAWLFTVGILGAVFAFLFRRNIYAYYRSRIDCSWTTFYFKSKVSHIHLVPLDGREHITDEDGECMCHTSKEKFDEETTVYRHSKLGV